MMTLILSLFLSVSAHAADTTTATGKWTKSTPSVLLSQGLKITNPNLCEKFEVEIAGENLQYKLHCGGYYNSALIPLKSDSIYKVDHGENSITITKMGYYGHKVQTGKISQSLIRVPYVEEIIYISFKNEGNISFYKEKFIVDDFGRVVQGNYVQAYDLIKSEVKVSQNRYKRIKMKKRRAVN